MGCYLYQSVRRFEGANSSSSPSYRIVLTTQVFYFDETMLTPKSAKSSLAVVGLIPGIIIIVFLGVFGLFTAWILIQFKLRHPEGKKP